MAIFDMHASDWVLRMPKVFRCSIDSWTGGRTSARGQGKHGHEQRVAGVSGRSSRVPWHRWMAKPCPGPEPEKLIWKQLSNLTMKINNSAINTKRAFWIMQATFSHQRSEVFKLSPPPLTSSLPFTPLQLPAYCSLLCCCPAVPLLLLLLLLFPFSLSAFIAVQLYIHCEKTGAWSKVTLERSCSRPWQLSIQYSSSKDETAAAAAATTTQL